MDRAAMLPTTNAGTWCNTRSRLGGCSGGCDVPFAATCQVILAVRGLGRANRDLEGRAFLLRVERWLLAQADEAAIAAE